MSIKLENAKKGNSYGKNWNDDGSIEIYKAKGGKPIEGKKYVLQKVKTHTLFHVKFDENGNVIYKQNISSGHKVV
jgi:hypothetical protein